MNNFFSRLVHKVSKKAFRKNISKWNKHQVKLDLLKLEERLVPAPNLYTPTTSSVAPLGITPGSLNLSGPLAISLLDTPTPASTSPLRVTIATSAGTASVGTPSNVTVTGDGTNNLQIQGPLSDINAALANLVYSSTTANATPATITVTATDNSQTPITDSKTIYVRTSDPATAPTITTVLADVAYTAETAATPVARPTIPVAVTDPQGSTGLLVTTTNDNPNLINGITVAGSTPNFTLAITTKTGITGTAVVTVRVADSLGNFTTKSFKVTVTPFPYVIAVDTLAGRATTSGAVGYTDGTGTAASFTLPQGATADNRGLVYVQDKNLIRSVNVATGQVTTLAGSTTTTTLADGVGSAAGIPLPVKYGGSPGGDFLAVMKVSPDNNWLYFINGGKLRKMGINPSDTANYKKVTSVLDFATAMADVPAWNPFGVMVFSSDGNTITFCPRNQQFSLVKQINLTTNTISTLLLDGSSANTINPRWMTHGPNGSIIFSTIGSGVAYVNSLISVDPATGAVTTLPNNIFAGNPAQGSAAYNPDANEILVDGGGSIPPRIIDATTGALKFTLPDTTTSFWANGVGASFDAWDAITYVNGTYVVSNSQGSTSAYNNIRTVRPAPGLYNPGQQTFNEGQPNYFDNAALEKMGVQANGASSITYTLTALYGTLDVGSITGLTGVTGRGTKSLSFTGSEANVNAALAKLAYTPDANFFNANTAGVQISGTPLETLTASATGTNANGITLGTNSTTLSVLVKALNNSPRIISPLPNQMYYAQPGVATESAINFTIADADTANTSFVNNATTGARITATSDNPNLILPADIAAAIGGSGNARTFTVKHQPNITGVANITITINDGGTSNLQNTYTFKVTVVPTPLYYWDILAGSPISTAGSTNGTGTAALLRTPVGMVRDSQGNLYVAEWSNHQIRKITPQGVVTTFAGSSTGTSGYVDGQGTNARFNCPNHLAIDTNGNIYVTEGSMGATTTPSNNRIRMIDPAGNVTTFAGSGTQAAVDGPLLTASFNHPTGIVIAPDGTMYVCELNSFGIRKISGGQVTTIAGLLNSPGKVDGIGTAARFNAIHGMALLPDGNLLVNDHWPNNRLAVVNTVTGQVTTISTSPGFYKPSLDPQGNWYLNDEGKMILVSSFGRTTLVGTGTAGNLLGVNTSASISLANGQMAFAPNGTIYLASTTNHNVRVGIPYPNLMNPGTQSTNMGTRLAFNSADFRQLGAVSNGLDSNNNPLPITLTLSAQFGTLDLNSVAAPAGVTVTFAPGNKSVTLAGNATNISTYLLNFGYTPDFGYMNVNSSGGDLASGAVPPDELSMSVTTANNLNRPVTGSLKLLVKGDSIPRIISSLPNRTYYVESGVATEPVINFTIADADTSAFTNNATTGARITVTSDNPNLILATDMATAIGGTANARTLTIKHQPNITGTANVTITIHDGTNSSTYTFQVTVVPTPNYYWGILAGSPAGTAGTANGTGTAATFSTPNGMVRDSQGNLFVADNQSHVIRKIDPVTGVVTTFAGTAGSAGLVNGTGTAARFSSPCGLTIDSQDNLYLADAGNHVIRMITPAGVVSTFAGTGVGGSADGALATATFRNLSDVVRTSNGVFYVADQQNHVIRKIENGQVTTIAGLAGTSGNVNGTGSAAWFNQPSWVTLTPTGQLLVRDAMNTGNIRLLDPATGVVTSFATGAANSFQGIGVDSSGLVYAGLSLETISLVSGFDSTVLVGTGTAGSVLGVNTAATISSPRQMVFAPNGTIYFPSLGQNNIRTGTPYPSLRNPGAQSTNEATRLAFNSAELRQLGAMSNGLDSNSNPLPITLKLSAQFGRLDFNNVAAPAGVTVTFAPGNKSVTLTGNATDINTYLLNFGYTPDVGYMNAKATAVIWLRARFRPISSA